MMHSNETQNIDHCNLWHPCSQMKDYETFKPLVVNRAYDSYIELSNGKNIIDAISSWWCKSLGHNHPTLKKALISQLERFEHVILANTTNDLIVRLSQELTHLAPHLNKVFYASDGASAIEIALKMSLHSRVIQGNHKRKRFIALKNGYHGESIGALSVSDIGVCRDPYSSLLFSPHLIDAPYVSGPDDAIWDYATAHWLKVEASLEPFRETATAIILEPILQGAGGMKVYSQDFLTKLANWAKENDIHLIADEVMTGIGRTGKMLACEHANIKPDFVCLGKGLTSGWMPMSAVITTNEVYNIFYDDYETGHTFLHSNTFAGNALAASVALATLSIIKQDALDNRANQLQQMMMQNLRSVAEKTQKIHNLRGIGAMVAADLMTDDKHQRLGYHVYHEAVKRGALLRPIGNTIYWLPPLTITESTLTDLKDITIEAINAVCPKTGIDKHEKYYSQNEKVSLLA